MWPQLFLVGTGALAARFALRAAQRSNIASKIPKISFDFSKLKGLDGFNAGVMGKPEALKVLNISPHQAIDADKVREVHRKLLVANHPDRGGSTFISTKINEAKEVLPLSTIATVDDFIRFLLSRGDKWSYPEHLSPDSSEAHRLGVDEAVTTSLPNAQWFKAVHSKRGEILIALLPPYESFKIIALPDRCAVAFYAGGDDPDDSVSQHLLTLRGPKRTALPDNKDADEFVVFLVTKGDPDERVKRRFKGKPLPGEPGYIEDNITSTTGTTGTIAYPVSIAK